MTLSHHFELALEMVNLFRSSVGIASTSKKFNDKGFVTAVERAEKHVIRILDPQIWNVCAREKVCHLSSWRENLHVLQSEDIAIMAIVLLRNSRVQNVKALEINPFMHHRSDVCIPKFNEIMNQLITDICVIH